MSKSENELNRTSSCKVDIHCARAVRKTPSLTALINKATELAHERANKRFQNRSGIFRDIAYESFVEGYLYEAFRNITKLRDFFSEAEIADIYSIPVKSVMLILDLGREDTVDDKD